MTKEAIEARLAEICAATEQLKAEEKELKKLLQELTVKENTKSYLMKIQQVNEDNSMVIRLYQDTRTTPIMDQFYSSYREFLVFRDAFTVGNSWTSVSLVVAKYAPSISMIDSGLTMTDLKKTVGLVVTENTLKYRKESERTYSLLKQLLDVEEAISAGTDRAAFESPIRLGGQTFKNQCGYGSIYEGTTMITQGTLYGETTGFYIIGVVKE